MAPSSSNKWAFGLLAGSALLLSACGSRVSSSTAAGAQQDLLGQPVATQGPAQTSGPTGSTPVGPADSGASSSLPGSSTTTPSGAAVPAGPASPMTSSAIAAKGPGWDTKTINIGIETVRTATSIGHALGVNSLDYGDQNGFVKAMVDYQNRHGGLFGRKINVVDYDVNLTDSDDTNGQAACATFTQDHRVVAAIAGTQNDAFYTCMRKAGVPMYKSGYGDWFTNDQLAQYDGYVRVWQNFSFDRLVPVWLQQLKAHGYFGGWNTAAGTAATSQPKVGLLYESKPLKVKAFTRLKAALQAQGYQVVADLQWTNPQDFSNFPVRLRSAGVTHLFLDSNATLFYPPQANSQHYYARYAVTSDDYIQPFLEESAPKTQLRGMVGVGWIPNQDVDLSHTPGPNPGQAACLKIMRDAGVSVAKDSYQYTAESVCDGFNLFLQMAEAGGGLLPGNLARGLSAIGPRFTWASMLSRGTSFSDYSAAPGLRALQWVPSCSCVQYVGPYINVP